MPNKSSNQTIENPVPDWVLALVGISVVAWFLYTFPVMEILNLFFTLFIVPVIFITCLCMGSIGGYKVISKNWNSTMVAVQTRVAEKVAKAA